MNSPRDVRRLAIHETGRILACSAQPASAQDRAFDRAYELMTDREVELVTLDEVLKAGALPLLGSGDLDEVAFLVDLDRRSWAHRELMAASWANEPGETGTVGEAS